MDARGLAVLSLVAGAAAGAAGGCGSSTRSHNIAASVGKGRPAAETPVTSGPRLTRGQLIKAGDTICRRLNMKRVSTRISTPQDYERLMPALAAYELAAAKEMRKIVAPPSMVRAWEQMTEATEQVSEVTGYYHKAADASNDRKARPLDVKLGRAINELTSTARQHGFHDCAKFL